MVVTGKWTGQGGPTLSKIPHHESNGIDGLSIEGLSIDLWQVVGHLEIPFMNTWWTCSRCAKTFMETQFLIPSTLASMFGHRKYGNTNRIPTIHGFPSLDLVGMKCIVPY